MVRDVTTEALLQVLSTAGTVGQFLVVTAAAVTALVQLRHMRASNELSALLSVERDFREESLQQALRAVQFDLPAKLRDPAYRAELTRLGFVDARVHREMDALNWFNQMGALVKNGLVDEKTFLDLFSRLVAYYWDLLVPVVALLRRQRGTMQYDNFEYIAMRARDWLARHPAGTYPAGAPRLDVTDVWREQDAPVQPPS